MKRYFLNFGLILLGLFCFWGDVKAANITASDDGVAPLYVHFFDEDASASDGVGLEPFHDYYYSWDFDDPGSGTWGSDGKTRNGATGPVSAHVYENQGTYTVSLTVIDSLSGTTIGTDTYTVTVNDPDTIYAGTLTTCVNTNSDNNFSGCPSGANQIQTDDITSITSYADAGERILFK